MVVERPQLVNLAARRPTSARARSMSSRYWRHPEYELNIDVTNPSALADSVGLHLAQRVGQKRMPVAITPINRQPRPVRLKLALQAGDQGASLIVDRALAIEMMIMLRDREHSLARNVAPAQHILEERNYVVGLLRSAERKHQDCVVCGPGIHHYCRAPASTAAIASVRDCNANRCPVAPNGPLPMRAPARRHGPSAIHPSPAAAVQVPESIHPNISWTGA